MLNPKNNTVILTRNKLIDYSYAQLCSHRNRRNFVYVCLFFSILLSSCFKEDRPIKLPEAPDSSVMSVFLGINYENQLFFNLEELGYVQRDINDWDLAFDNITEKFKVVTNYGRDIFIAHTPFNNIEDLTSIETRQLEWLYDFPSGNIDSNAIGDWTNTYGNSTPYFIVDMGRLLAKELRYYFIKIESADQEKYIVKHGNLNETENETTTVIPRNKMYNASYLNLRTQKLSVDFEPQATDWDIVFTRYRHIFYIDPNPDAPFPYLVTGALLNPNNVQVAIDTAIGFQQIDLSYCQSLTYSSQQDIIGYAWKAFDFTVSFTYTINPNTSYIIKNHQGNYYKLRFLDFYDDNRQKGYPKFELQRVVR